MKYLKGKTWIDWVKIIIAIDVTSVGIGLIFQHGEIHILANLLGSFTRIIFGILYILVAGVIFKGVFPELVKDLRGKGIVTPSDETPEEEPEITEEETVGGMINDAAKKIDEFVHERADEVKDEVHKVFDEEQENPNA